MDSHNDDRNITWAPAALMLRLAGCRPGLAVNAVETLRGGLIDLEQVAAAMAQDD